MNKFNKVVNSVYEYIDADDPDDCKKHLENVLEFVIRLRHSYVDNDKPMSSQDVNIMILRKALEADLKVVNIDGRKVIMRER